MTSCIVYFYKKVCGVPFSLPQGSVRISIARTEARALEAAKRRFARRRGVDDWTLRADSYDLVYAGEPGSLRPRTETLKRMHEQPQAGHAD
jgi:hypothetical protein